MNIKQIDLDSIVYGNQNKNLGRWEAKVDTNSINLIIPPFKNSSQETHNEIIELAELTTNATDMDLDNALLLDKNLGYDFGRVLDKHHLEFPKQEFNSLWKIIGDYIMYFKWHFNRPRPKQLMEYYNENISVNTPDSAKTPSYPSGHTAYAETMKIVIQRKYPMIRFNQSLDKAVNNMAKSRMVLGVHYPSDNTASIEAVNNLIAYLQI